MRPRLGPFWFLLALVAVLGASSPAHAWTRTVVKSAHASVDIDSDGTLHVLLRLDVDVLAGWLHELELADLGEGVELNRYQPPYFRSAEGKVRRPDIEVTEDGRIRLSFRWRDAPKRGEHRVYIRYRTKADVSVIDAGGARKARIVWSVPAWETGLHGVRVDIRAPKGSSVPLELHEALPGIRHQINEHTTRTFVEWRRIHLPRTTAWPLTIDVPAQSLALTVPTPEDAPRPEGFRPLPANDSRPLAWPLLFVAVLFLLKRRAIEMRMGRDVLLIRSPWPVTLVTGGGLLAMGQWLVGEALVLALPLLLLLVHRPMEQTSRPEERSWRPVAYRDLPRRETLPADLLDATTAPGLLTLFGCSLALLTLGQPMAALLALPAFSVGTRLHVAPTATESANVLGRFAAALQVPDGAPEMAFAWEVSSDGLSRLTVALPGHRAGLLSLGFVVTTSRVGFVCRRKVMLAVETRAQSDADDLVRRRTHTEPDARAGGHILRLVEWNAEAIELLRTLARKTPKQAKASRGTWLLREISESRRHAA